MQNLFNKIIVPSQDFLNKKMDSLILEKVEKILEPLNFFTNHTQNINFNINNNFEIKVPFSNFNFQRKSSNYKDSIHKSPKIQQSEDQCLNDFTFCRKRQKISDHHDEDLYAKVL